MAKQKKKPKQVDPDKILIASNRRALREYEITDTLECGMVLMGSEVKSLREAKVTLADSFARVIDNELWLIGLHIAPYSYAAGFGAHDTERQRKLLVHRREIDRLVLRQQQERLTLAPLSMYFLKGKAKVEIGVARGRSEYDKRQVIAKRESDLEARREMARGIRARAGD